MAVRRADELCRSALDLPPQERERFLLQSCSGDPALLSAVSLRMLALSGEATVVRPRLAVGRRLGERYRIEARLGSGGMGEVWLAYDLKLHVEVALKALFAHQRDDERVEMLRREVRAARNVTSQHVCRVFDLLEFDGEEYVSMEYVDGETLQSRIERSAPFDLGEARRIAQQLLTGLQAIHEAGLIHRDLKPANVMITRTGRIVIMDFGLAKGLTDAQSHAFAGTPVYMAPEQRDGGELGPWSDLFAVGVILAEMVAPAPAEPGTLRFELWEGLRREPPQVPAGPWEPVIRRAVAHRPRERFGSAAEMARSLGGSEAQTGIADDVSPYPGLSMFTVADAPFFFGRELDIEALWRKLQRLSLTALIGPSGVGKSSFLRAGVIATRPRDWRVVLCTPGDAPFLALGRALVPEFEGRTDAVQDLFRLHELERSIPLLREWRRRDAAALVIVDQFEELFTLNSPEVQERFAELLGRLAVEADIHVLVSMRDDFFFHCHRHTPLRPLFSEATPLAPLSREALRRALVQPALRCGHRFEDEALPDEMLAQIEGERGALPMLAFAAARLWEHRDRARALLTREGYARIGGVAGALAQHAETVLLQIGPEREPIVRELFRNLVTAQQTRLVRDREELLSVFEDRRSAEEVLAALIDARLLTSFEIGETRGAAVQHRIEIVHESLLSSWPRLVRWQAQDVEGAQLRDQLRMAAQLWAERNRSDDLLWMGTAYREFALWRERYPGGLTETEADFAAAMQARALRGRRRRRIAVTGSFTTLLVVVAVVGGLWQRARDEARRSDAARLLLYSENVDLNEDNTLALALATASLEREDTPAGRRMALRALTAAPVRRVLTTPDTMVTLDAARLSRAGDFLATVNEDGVLVWPRDGSEPRSLTCETPAQPHRTLSLDVDPQGRYLAATRIPTHVTERLAVTDHLVTLWSIAEGRALRTWRLPRGADPVPVVRGEPPHVDVSLRDFGAGVSRWVRCTLDSDEVQELGTTPRLAFVVTRDGHRVLYPEGDRVQIARMDQLGAESALTVGRHESSVANAIFDADEDLVASVDAAGRIRIWSLQEDGRFELAQDFFSDASAKTLDSFDPENQYLVYTGSNSQTKRMLALAHPEARPVAYVPDAFVLAAADFTPEGDWLGFAWCDERLGGGREYRFYPTARSRPQVHNVLPENDEIWPNFFLPDGSTLVARNNWEELVLCQVSTREPALRSLWRNPYGRFECAVAGPDNRYICVNNWRRGRALVIPVDGSEPIVLDAPQGIIYGIDIEAGNRRVAVSGGQRFPVGLPDLPIIDVHDLQTGTKQVLRAEGECGFFGVGFLPEDRLFSYSHEGLLLWNLRTGDYEVLSDRKYAPLPPCDLDAERRFLLVNSPAGVTLWDLRARTERILPIPTEHLMTSGHSLALAPDASFVVAGMDDGAVLVFHVDSGESQWLLGHSESIGAVWISPDSRQIRTAANDGRVMIWDVPTGVDVDNAPHSDVLRYLRQQTNLRVVLDAEASDGYRIVHDRFPGWESAPSGEEVSSSWGAATGAKGSPRPNGSVPMH